MKIYGWKLRSVFVDDGRMSFELDYTAYLRAKVVIDDEALNKRVYDSFVSHLEALSASKSGPLRILEVAGGIGTMIVRVRVWFYSFKERTSKSPRAPKRVPVPISLSP